MSFDSDFYTEVKRSQYFQPYWNEFYKSQYFYDVLQRIRKKGKVEILNIDRSENPLFQSETYLDAVISLSTGTSIRIDEKTPRYALRYNGDFAVIKNMYPVEVWSNPTGKKDGWGYHIGTTICQTYASPLDDCFCVERPPVIYTISQNFVDNVIRNPDFPSRPNSRTTNNLYRSGYKWVPRKILEGYFP